MARKGRPVSFGDILRAGGGHGRGPWEVSQYSGPPETIVGTDGYERMVRQHLGNEKRRIKHRLIEIKRYKHGQTWVGPIPTEEELEWWDREDQLLQIRRSLRNKPSTKEETTEEEDEEEEEPLVKRRRRIRRNNMPDMPVSSPPVEYEDSVPETVPAEDIIACSDL